MLTADLAPPPADPPEPAPPAPPRVAEVVPRHVTHARPPKVEKLKKTVTKADPVTLVGMAPPAIGKLLGKPAGTREYAMTTEWTYETPVCSLVIFFYPDITTGALRALKYNATGPKGGTGNGPSCVHNILLARNDDRG
jgi:hypothetical protein